MIVQEETKSKELSVSPVVEIEEKPRLVSTVTKRLILTMKFTKLYFLAKISCATEKKNIKNLVER